MNPKAIGSNEHGIYGKAILSAKKGFQNTACFATLLLIRGSLLLVRSGAQWRSCILLGFREPHFTEIGIFKILLDPQDIAQFYQILDTLRH